MPFLEKLFQVNPAAKLQFEKDQSELGKKYQQQIAKRASDNRALNVQAIITIPVVVHIVLPNANDVTDAAVQDQINILNADYAGLNPDSTNATGFYPVRGHSEIRFCLAQRTPSNALTNGIERRNSATISSNGSVDPIKFTAQGGLDTWDPSKYLNIWVSGTTSPGAGQVILGYSTFPGLFAPFNEHGVVIHYRAFSSINPTGTTLFSFAAKGRTSSHEIGHFFNLRHIWGDQAGCSTDDLVSDTPLQDDASSGCSSGIITDACTTSGAGINYQNYMDYSDDQCLTMFTNLQGVRMQTSLSDPTRIGLTTSNGCTPPVLTPDNASIFAFVTPPPNTATCDPTIPLTVTLRNEGTNNLTSVVITVINNGTVVETFSPVGLNLTTGSSQNIVLNPIVLSIGSNVIDVCTSLPNGVADTGPSNDCKSTNVIKGGNILLPLVEGFENATFPPAGWRLVNPDNSYTWERNTIGLMHGGTADAYVNHYNYSTLNETDDLITPSYSIGAADSLWVSFWGAYKGYPNDPFDEFEVAVSSNCGGSFTTVYRARNDTAFAEEPVTTNLNWTTSSLSQWKRKSLDLSSFISSGSVQLRFRTINKYGNNFFLDDINLDKKTFPNNDAGVAVISSPLSRLCTNSGTPVAIIRNYGKNNLTSVKINYQLDGTGPITTFNWTGNLARLQFATVSLAGTNFGNLGNHSIRIYTTEPNGVTDQDPGNDSQTKPYQILQILPLPGSVTEDFTSSTFPPINWNVYNPDGDMTWTRNGSIGRKSPGSAFFNDYNNNTIDRFDDLALPNYFYSGIDSIFITFNLATITKTLPGTTGSRLDTLSVLLSKDCGNTFTTVYKKYGVELQTVNDPNFPPSLNEFFPTSNQWRMDSVNLGNWLSGSEPIFQVMFRFNGNFENNLFLDDINLRTEILPARLKNEGYLILPNPFRNKINVWHYQLPTNLRYINVYSATGQLVWSKQYSGNADKIIEVDLSRNASGTYTVSMGYATGKKDINIQVVKY